MSILYNEKVTVEGKVHTRDVVDRDHQVSLCCAGFRDAAFKHDVISVYADFEEFSVSIKEPWEDGETATLKYCPFCGKEITWELFKRFRVWWTDKPPVPVVNQEYHEEELPVTKV